MVKWLPPNGFTGKVHHLDARVGGTYKRHLQDVARLNAKPVSRHDGGRDCGRDRHVAEGLRHQIQALEQIGPTRIGSKARKRWVHFDEEEPAMITIVDGIHQQAKCLVVVAERRSAPLPDAPPPLPRPVPAPSVRPTWPEPPTR